jgi:uncharacterized protein (UPF0332 family)
LERAREALAEGDALLRGGRSRGAVNRLYYAALQAARALLALRNLDSARHSGVIALFQAHFVKTGLVEPDLARALPRAFEKRLNTDYADFSDVTPDEVERIRSDVSRFVDACAALLDRLLTEGQA